MEKADDIIDYKAVGKRIKTVRRNKGLSQKALATVMDWVQGLRIFGTVAFLTARTITIQLQVKCGLIRFTPAIQR